MYIWVYYIYTMNIVAIDPSLISTAVIIYNGKDFKIYNYCREKDAYGKLGLRKWYKLAEQFVNYRFIEYRSFDNYSEGEIKKIKDYDSISDLIIDDIISNIDSNLETYVGIEGYNFGAKVGDLLDLVSFSTLLRNKLFDRVSENIEVFSPSTLKLESCKLTYEPKIKNIGGKNPRVEYKWYNNIGIPGGKFQKTDIYRSIIENNKLDDYWYKHCLSVKDDILSSKIINKPYEDINDAYLLFLILKKNNG